jgi:predicted DNA-binding transcriptional regulator AlpA
MKKFSIPEPDRIVRFPEVERFVGVHRVTLLRWIQNETFLRPFKLADDGKAIGWRLSTLMAWLDSRAAAGAAHSEAKTDAERGR